MSLSQSSPDTQDHPSSDGQPSDTTMPTGNPPPFSEAGFWWERIPDIQRVGICCAAEVHPTWADQPWLEIPYNFRHSIINIWRGQDTKNFLTAVNALALRGECC